MGPQKIIRFRYLMSTCHLKLEMYVYGLPYENLSSKKTIKNKKIVLVFKGQELGGGYENIEIVTAGR